MADPQAEGNPAGAGGIAAGGTFVALERQAREPPSTLALGMGEYRLLTKKKDWTEPQRKMMRRAGRVHRVLGLCLATVLILLWLGRL